MVVITNKKDVTKFERMLLYNKNRGKDKIEFKVDEKEILKIMENYNDKTN